METWYQIEAENECHIVILYSTTRKQRKAFYLSHWNLKHQIDLKD